MKFQIGNCCCNACNSQGNNSCQNNQVIGLPNDIYIIISGEIYDPGYTESDLKSGGLIPDNINDPSYTGWNITTTITYEAGAFSWLFNRKWKLRNQASWDWDRTIIDNRYADIENAITGHLCRDSYGPPSGERLDCYYEFSRIEEINENLRVQGCYSGAASWDWSFYARNATEPVSGFDLSIGQYVLIDPVAICPSCYNTYPLFVGGNIYPNKFGDCGCINIPQDSCNSGTFSCGSFYWTDSADLYKLSYFQAFQGEWITIYNYPNITAVDTSDTIIMHPLDMGPDFNLVGTMCGGIQLIWPRLDFDWIYKPTPNGTPGQFRFQAINYTLMRTVVDEGDDPNYPGYSIAGLEQNPADGSGGTTYSAGLRTVRNGFTLDFTYPTTPLSYQDLLDTTFLPYTGSNNLSVKATLECPIDNYISINNTGGAAYAQLIYHNIINDSYDHPERKTATYKVISCGVRNIKIAFTCDPSGAEAAIDC